jgi:hypothetical protein
VRFTGTRDELLTWLREDAARDRNQARGMTGAAKAKAEGRAEGTEHAVYVLSNWTEEPATPDEPAVDLDEPGGNGHAAVPGVHPAWSGS